MPPTPKVDTGINGGAPPGSDAQVAITAERTMWAEGIYGQVIAVDRVDDLVMIRRRSQGALQPGGDVTSR